MRRDREARQLDLGYRGSSLSAPGSVCGRVQAGDRAPDAPCRGQAGQRTRLFMIFQGSHWTLLGYQPHDRPSAIAGVRIVAVGAEHELVDEDGNIAEAYGIEPGQWVLMRRTVTSPGSFPLTDWSRNFRATSRMCCRPARPIHSQGHDGEKRTVGCQIGIIEKHPINTVKTSDSRTPQ